MLQFFSNLADFIGILALPFRGCWQERNGVWIRSGFLFSRSRRRSEAEFFVTW